MKFFLTKGKKMAELMRENSFQDRDDEEDDERRSVDEFWDALSSNYDYLMDDGLIATCREASSDLSVDEESDLHEEEEEWERFDKQFGALHELLASLRGREEGERGEEERVSRLSRLLGERAQELCRRRPELREEVHRRLQLLQSKWRGLGGGRNPLLPPHSEGAVLEEISGCMRGLRRWLRGAEGRLSSPVLPDLTPHALRQKHREQIALQREVEERGRRWVSSLLRACDRLEAGQGRLRRVAGNLERRWHALWLSSLERQCAIEEEMTNAAKCQEKLEKSFSEEPLSKYPRLSQSFEAVALLEDELNATSNEVSMAAGTVSRNNKAVMVGDTGIGELKKRTAEGSFEIVQDVGYSSETSAHLSNDDSNRRGRPEKTPPTYPVEDVFRKAVCVDPPPEEEEGPRAGRRDLLKKSVCDWLNRCHSAEGGGAGNTEAKSGDWPPKAANASCDASGECTTDSDSEKSDINNSVTFSQSFTGSIETVVPSTPCVVPSTPCVRLRHKKRRPARGRPCSLDVKRVTYAPHPFPHSISEGALHLLSSPTLPNTLTDVSSAACPAQQAGDDSKVVLSETNTTEDQASLSDQAWDEYQDPPYLSENYSEQPLDEEEVRRVISFGEDYASTLGPPLSPTPPPPSTLTGNHSTKSYSDTNSDSDDFHHILETSSQTLHFVQCGMGEEGTPPAYAELLSTAQTNLRLLTEISSARCQLDTLHEGDVCRLQNLIGEWECVRGVLLSRGELEAEELLSSLREKLGEMGERAKGALAQHTSLEQLNSNIQQLQCSLSRLHEMKACLLGVSARVLRMGGERREGATLLHRQWEDVYELNCTQLTMLQELQSGWGKTAMEGGDGDTAQTETAIKWKPAPIKKNLATAKVEPMRMRNVGAEVQTSDRHDALRDMPEGSPKSLSPSPGRTPPEEEGGTPVWWRVLRASLPFQLLLLLLLCLSGHTQPPPCCEHASNPFALHLRYTEGPPPV